jgi:hypothetical protein
MLGQVVKILEEVYQMQLQMLVKDLELALKI